MDRGIPTEEVLAEMRQSQKPISYLVGTPKARLSKMEAQLLELPWQNVRPGLEVKLLPQDQELYVFAQSRERICKERSMRRRQMKALWKRFKELEKMTLKSKELLMKLGEARGRWRIAWRLMEIEVPEVPTKQKATFSFRLNGDKLREARRREGRYLLRTNLRGSEPAQLWQLYIQLTQVEEAFKNLKGDLAVRPIHHQLERRIEAHIFVCFLAYCLHVHLRASLRPLAPGLSPRSILEKFAAMQMLDVHFPTTDGRELVFHRYTQPEKDHQMLLAQLGWELPPQSPPRITQKGKLLEE
jgi:transposase